MTKPKTKNEKKKQEEDWAPLRIRKATHKKLKILKAQRDDLIFDDTLQYLLSKENLK